MPSTTVQWVTHETLLIATAGDQTPSSKIAAFDLDDTWIVPKSKRVHSKDADDWKWIYVGSPDKLRALVKEGFRIVVLTNQGGLTNDDKEEIFRTKVENIAATLDGVPLLLVAAKGRDHFRKPRLGMWEYFATHLNGGVEIDLSASYYVGDAAGRPNDWTPGFKKDWADTDRKLALNMRVDFHIPETFFGNQKTPPLPLLEFDPAVYLESVVDKAAPEPALALDAAARQQQPDVVVFVGFPASGKSHAALKHFVPNGYVHVNQDNCRSRAACLKLAEQSLQNKSSIVIDNTNPDRKAREGYVALAKKYGASVRCLWFRASLDLCNHNNAYREHIQKADHSHVPDVAFASFRSRFEEPLVDEGFGEVIPIDFVPQFESDAEKQSWLMFHF
ncbi:polynucleotide kinase 3 phosphatase-domain-containing protein [Polychytrium aggregatum]|uniref:polynucleotide kinase 3 phosphatase-domain-containing protein n=1 Tax=Polychytrium aggregatum TaxID=110093 RepID=UPI0022FEE72F|nr:polynucleotide kinase 3 phosphatase-domain-containing protein [Polychytrium aggregatum]KAI9206310.1 polynucleotide kinase 3 phosphatase-domain-containing protein [Polychytrium aggregatum]